MFSCGGSPDPFVLRDRDDWGRAFRQTAGLTPRPFQINPSLKTLIAITTGQSPLANVVPSAFVPTNAGVIDQLNILDGGLYSIAGKLLSSTEWQANQGNATARLVDKFVPAFDRAMVACLNIGSTTTDDWTTGRFADRIPVLMRRLAARGITPTTPGITWANFIGIGEQDLSNGTSQAAMTAGLNGMIAQAIAAGFPGRFFVALESARGQTSNAIRSAQAAVVNGTSVFSLGDFDSAPVTTYDGVHPNDAGAAALATIAYSAVHASGAPF